MHVKGAVAIFCLHRKSATNFQLLVSLISFGLGAEKMEMRSSTILVSLGFYHWEEKY